MRFITGGKSKYTWSIFWLFSQPSKDMAHCQTCTPDAKTQFHDSSINVWEEMPEGCFGLSVFSTEYVQDKVSDSVRNYLPLPRLSHMLHTLHLPVAYPVSGPII